MFANGGDICWVADGSVVLKFWAGKDLDLVLLGRCF